MRPAIVQPILPALSPTTKFCGGMPASIGDVDRFVDGLGDVEMRNSSVERARLQRGPGQRQRRAVGIFGEDRAPLGVAHVDRSRRRIVHLDHFLRLLQRLRSRLARGNGSCRSGSRLTRTQSIQSP